MSAGSGVISPAFELCVGILIRLIWRHKSSLLFQKKLR